MKINRLKCFLFFAIVFFNIDYVISQKRIVDTLHFKNSTFFTTSKISKGLKDSCKNNEFLVISFENIEQKVFIFNGKIFPLSELNNEIDEFNKQRKLYLYPKEKDISEYLIKHNMVKFANDSIYNKNKLLTLIIEN